MPHEEPPLAEMAVTLRIVCLCVCVFLCGKEGVTVLTVGTITLVGKGADTVECDADSEGQGLRSKCQRLAKSWVPLR